MNGFSNSPESFLSTCWRNLLPQDFSREPLVCVSSRDTDVTNHSFLTNKLFPAMTGRLQLQTAQSLKTVSFKYVSGGKQNKFNT